MSYDYTVLAGTQGLQNHRKKDRLFELAEPMRLPVVFFTEGGGGRPGDTDGTGVAGSTAWRSSSSPGSAASCRSSASTPATASPATPRCSACCDVVIATEDSNIGMGGPAMIEGGGLGVYEPTDDRPDDGAAANGVDRRRGRRRGRGVSRRQAVPVVLPGSDRRRGTCADQTQLRSRRSPRTGCAATTCAR